MTSVKITCPECKHEFSPDQSLKHQLDHMMQEERNQLQSAYQLKEESLKTLENQLQKKESEIEDLITARIVSEKAKLRVELEQKVKEDFNAEVDSLKGELQEKQLKLNKAKELELENERIKRKAKEREADILLDAEKKLQKREAEIEAQIIAREGQRQDMKLAEKEKQLSDLRKQLEEARRKAEQGSMQTQGEVHEIALEELLQDIFRFDSIHEVPKGTNGADVVQTVRTQFGKECGTIAFECKNAKNFDPKWIAKLKEDMRIHAAAHGILVTEVMPKDMPTFGARDGVWICTVKEVAGLTAAIRQICITEASISAAEKNRDSKVHALYDYLMSREFKQRVEGVIQAVGEMKTNVEKERKSMLAFWKKQEIQIDQMNFLMIDIVGSIDGLSGNALGPVRGLELGENDEAA